MSEIPPPPPSGDDDGKSRAESALLGTKPLVPELAADSQRRLHIEIMNLRSIVFWAARWFVRGIFVLAFAAVWIWAIHVLAPLSWRWLQPDEIEHLQSILFSGSLGALVTFIGKRLF